MNMVLQIQMIQSVALNDMQIFLCVFSIYRVPYLKRK